MQTGADSFCPVSAGLRSDTHGVCEGDAEEPRLERGDPPPPGPSVSCHSPWPEPRLPWTLGTRRQGCMCPTVPAIFPPSTEMTAYPIPAVVPLPRRKDSSPPEPGLMGLLPLSPRLTFHQVPKCGCSPKNRSPPLLLVPTATAPLRQAPSGPRIPHRPLPRLQRASPGCRPDRSPQPQGLVRSPRAAPTWPVVVVCVGS